MLQAIIGSEKFKMVAFKTGYTHIAACRQDGDESSKAISMFSGSAYLIGLLRMLLNLTGSDKSKMAASRIAYRPTHISTRRQDRNAITKAILMCYDYKNPFGAVYELTGSVKLVSFKPAILSSRIVDFLLCYTAFLIVPLH